MWPYWFMFLFPVWGVLMPGKLKAGHAWMPWAFVFLLFAFMMGLRHEVGGDWGTYSSHFLEAGGRTFLDVVTGSDPGYYLLNWIFSKVGGGIYHVNSVCAAVMMWGTLVFCRSQPNPWLALLAAVPYMLVVVGMGYTRQSVALGFALLGLAALGHGRTRTFVIWIAIGATFHKSAVLLLPIAALAASRNRLLTATIVGATTLLLYYLLLADASEALWQNYVEAQYQSQGGMIRVLMNVVPATLLVLLHKRLVSDPQERKLWLWIAAFAFACLPLVSLASTAVDRVALYLIPVQLFFFSRIPRLANTVQTRTPLVLGAVVYYAAVLFVWLNFAVHSLAWVPYQNILFL